MRILPLGGAGEVGASATIIEIAGVRLMVDAGIRVASGAKGSPLPDFALIGAPPDALIVTHAHTDHTGALPLVLPYLGDAGIHMTTASLHLLEVLQGDAVRNMELAELEHGPGRVMYTLDDVEQAIARTEGHGFRSKFCPVPGRLDVTCEFIPSGHILGAGMLLIDTPERRVLWTGDYSITPQPTIGGLDLEDVRALAAERAIDVLVTESTYGTQSHPPRADEDRRFVDLLERVTRKGGKVLIPAFAVGRAQDLTHVIRAAKLAGRLVDVPVYLDGMVRPVTSIYENITHTIYPEITAPLQLLDPEHGIFKANGQSRAKLLSGEATGPAIVISSSGMLTGGRSVQYLKAFAEHRRNAVLISGYSDEESAARAIQSLKRGGALRLPDGSRLKVRCLVGRYHTSAHADGPQIEALVAAANPTKIGLVHGDPGALEALAARLGKRRTTIFANGTPFEIKHRRKVWSTRDAASAAPPADTPDETGGATRAGRRLPTEPEVRELWQRLTDEGDREYTEAEMARHFLGSRYTPGEREALGLALADHRLYFITGSRLGQRSYRPRPKEEVIDLLIERGAAYQLELHRGDLVVFSDGSPDLFVAAVERVHHDVLDAIVPMSRRTNFRREWVRGVVQLGLTGFIGAKSRAYVARWLEGVTREARTLPTVSAVDLYYAALARPDRRLSLAEALECSFPGREGCYSGPMHVAVALAITGARALFQLPLTDHVQARPLADVLARWRLFERIHHVRSLEAGAPVDLQNGTVVRPTGVFFADSFEARTEDGGWTRANYRRVRLPGEPISAEPEPEAPSASVERGAPVVSGVSPDLLPDGPTPPRGRRRKRRRGKAPRASSTTAVAPSGEAGAPVADAAPEAERRGKRRRRRRGGPSGRPMRATDRTADRDAPSEVPVSTPRRRRRRRGRGGAAGHDATTHAPAAPEPAADPRPARFIDDEESPYAPTE